jgi:glycosyltransferase involved in cell wall biosynthesis
MAERYKFRFEEGSTYDRCVQLLAELQSPPDALVLDLGAGYGAPAEGVADLGLRYVGCDLDGDGLDDLAERGFETHAIDLRDAALADRIVEVVAGRPVAAIVLLDTVEHLPETRALLGALSDAAARVDEPAVVLSIPNVAHRDIAVKLLAAGRFDYMPVGLLDQTHVQLFTEARLTGDMGAFGWMAASSRDVLISHTEQRFPAGHPALDPATPVFAHLTALRALADPHGEVYQFVRRYERTSQPIPSQTHDESGDIDARRDESGELPFVSVIMRTRGDRERLLADAMLCLAAQTDDDFELLVMVHVDSPAALADVHAIVERFAEPFRQRVRVHAVHGGGRARPLNTGLELARGEFIAFLDDDDVVTANWIEAFRSAATAPSVLRSRCYVRSIEPHPHPDAPFEIVERPRPWYSAEFSFIEHLYANQTPICSFALPRALVTELSLRFDETLAVLEDWDLLLRAASIAGVIDSGEITSVYNFWHDRAGSRLLHDAPQWADIQLAILDRFDHAPLLLPARSASRLHDLHWQLENDAFIAERRTAEVEHLQAHVRSLEHELAVFRRLGLVQALAAPRHVYRKLRRAR